MAIGANLVTKGRTRIWMRMMEILGQHGLGKGRKKSKLVVFRKSGAPASNTAADSPGKANAFILDETNDDVYFCHTYTNDTSFTVVKITN